MKVAIASDHAGLRLKRALLEVLREANAQAVDLGTDGEASVDYPDFAGKVAQQVASGQVELGVLICGSGIGMSIAANKYAGVRAALCHTEYEARMARAHNDANVLCLGERVVGAGVAAELLKAFLSEPFQKGRHQARVDKISALEKA